ncbi:type II secretion system inner membrane protein GspF [Marinomonas algicola]|uniref:type II secretion system inner membrane protein GspF n=1 Tax=Marinomonas algicola TaxID=2773454 RepID=UPI00174BE226|nr:type II secretion system inner membrane protein GspF [Marinomonas algicola]
MAAFEYLALDRKGRKRKGVLEADNERHLRQLLRDKGMTPLEIKQGKERTRHTFFSPSINVKDRALLTRQLATLIDAGLPIEEAITGVAQQASKQKLRSMLLSIRSKVLEGHSLAKALESYPKAFPVLFRASVEAGEQSGHLQQVLTRLADYTERQRATAQKIQMAMMYPIILTLVAIGIVSFLLGSVMPDIVSVFDKQGAALPPITEFMLSLSYGVTHYGQLILVVFVLTAIVYKWLMTKQTASNLKDRLVLRILGLRKWVVVAQITRYISTLAMLSSSGVALVDAMKIAAQVVDNSKMQQQLTAAMMKVQEGGSLGNALDETTLLPPMMLQLIKSGERSGELDSMLARAAHQQEEESHAWMTTLVGLFEPLMLLVMGGVVMMIVMAILLPIMNMNQLLN